MNGTHKSTFILHLPNVFDLLIKPEIDLVNIEIEIYIFYFYLSNG